ncbi:nucleotidyltransferase family protein [Candidatus Woesearchaeota archaeon]|nr:nucleotidyltransferase family protein [Candidatus Woesearchaeota archaeon]
MAPNGAYKILKNFERENILTKEKIGNASIFSLNLSNPATKLLIQLVKAADKERLSLKVLLKSLKNLETEIKKDFRAEIIGVFGSYARGDQKKSSDLDILARFHEDASYFDLVALASFLEKELKIKVDLVSERALRPELKEHILQEVVAV